jgi:hypothetical protein
MLGITAAWYWFRSRTTLELERIRSESAVKLASVRERAIRIPMLEAQLAKHFESEQSHRAEILRLTEEQAERRQLLRSTAEQLLEAKAQLTHALKCIENERVLRMGAAVLKYLKRRATCSSTATIPPSIAVCSACRRRPAVARAGYICIK